MARILLHYGGNKVPISKFLNMKENNNFDLLPFDLILLTSQQRC